MIHVSVTHEYIADSKQYSRRKRGDIADVKQQRAPLEFQIDADTWVAPDSADESCIEDRSRHRSPAEYDGRHRLRSARGAIMTIAASVQDHLNREGVRYETI